MKPTILLLFILILVSSRINGQEKVSAAENTKTFSMHLLTGLNQIREKELLPLVHKGTVTELSFETEKVKNSIRQFQFYFTYSRLKTGLEELSKSANIGFGLNYSRNFPVFRKNNFQYYAGPKASWGYSLMLFPNWDESHSYWADYLSFGVNNILLVSLKHDREWYHSVSIPLLVFFSRPEPVRQYKIDDISAGGVLKALNSDIEAGFIKKALLVTYRTEYRFPVFTDKREAFTFNMDVLRMSRKDGNPVFQIISMFGIKIML